MRDIQVSVSCITYNQADYIEDAIKSFLNQKTSFEFEILIHDDASTDGTAEIVKRYADAYPDKITAVFQKENQYSRGVKIAKTYLFPLYRGKYIAVCEGDDYWTSDDKLQKQFEYMEAHPKCNLCVHGSYNVSAGKRRVMDRNVLSDGLTVYGMGDAIKGLGRKVATNSFFYRKEVGEAYPAFRENAPCGDYVIPIICAERGTIDYLPDIMCAHRVFAKGSLSSLWRKDPDKKKAYNLRYDEMLRGIDEYTNRQYGELLRREHDRIWFDYYVAVRDIKTLRSPQFRKHFAQLSLKEKVTVFLEVFSPGMITLIRRCKLLLLGFSGRV